MYIIPGVQAGTRPSLPSCIALFKINDQYPSKYVVFIRVLVKLSSQMNQSPLKTNLPRCDSLASLDLNLVHGEGHAGQGELGG